MVLSEEKEKREGEVQSQEGGRGRGRKGMGRRGLFWRLLSWLSSLTSTCTSTGTIDATTAETALVPTTLLTGAGRPDFTRTLEKSRAVLGETVEKSVVLIHQSVWPWESHLISTGCLLTHQSIMLLTGLSSATLKGMLNFLERSQPHLYPSTQACPVFLAPLSPASPPSHWPFSQHTLT